MQTGEYTQHQKYNYRSFQHPFFPEEAEPCLAYGIALYRTDSSMSEPLASIPAITTQKDKVTRMTALLNRAQVSPSHFYDVIDDLLASRTPDEYPV